MLTMTMTIAIMIRKKNLARSTNPILLEIMIFRYAYTYLNEATSNLRRRGVRAPSSSSTGPAYLSSSPPSSSASLPEFQPPRWSGLLQQQQQDRQSLLKEATSVACCGNIWLY